MTITASCNQQKPMSISSITSPLNALSSPSSSPYHNCHHDNYKAHHLISFVHYTNAIDADEATTAVDSSMTECKQHQHQLPPSFYYSSSSESSSLSSSYTANGIERSPSPLSSSTAHQHVNKRNESLDENSGSNKRNNSIMPPTTAHFSPGSVSGPLSLQERRQRNKTASAKYRAKKNQQHQGMRSMIHTMTKENDLLLRQLEQAKSENRQLKSVCDKLRSKMMAEKMFKKMLYHQQQQPDHHYHAYFQSPTDDVGGEMDSIGNVNDNSEDDEKTDQNDHPKTLST